jgi:hypothetical protein
MMEAELSSEVGPAGRLFKSSVDLFWALLQRTSILNLKTAQKDALRDEFGKFYFWGDGYYPFEGRLDEILYNSSRLRYRVLSVLGGVLWYQVYKTRQTANLSPRPLCAGKS